MNVSMVTGKASVSRSSRLQKCSQLHVVLVSYRKTNHGNPRAQKMVTQTHLCGGLLSYLMKNIPLNQICMQDLGSPHRVYSTPSPISTAREDGLSNCMENCLSTRARVEDHWQLSKAVQTIHNLIDTKLINEPTVTRTWVKAATGMGLFINAPRNASIKSQVKGPA